MLGSRQQLEQMNEAVERNDIHPVIDEKVFSLEKLITTRATGAFQDGSDNDGTRDPRRRYRGSKLCIGDRDC